MEYVGNAASPSAFASANSARRALYEDRCLYIVPGSHKQPRTPEQRSLSSSQVPPENPLDMPGAIQVILHRTFFSLRA